MAGVVISRKKARMEAAVQIPDDVTVEILKLLPVKSLLRFSCACKTWYSTISDPEFCNKQHRKSACLLICQGFETFFIVESLLKEEEKKTPIRSAPLPLPWQPEPEPEEQHTSSSNEVLGSCNGLVCVNYISSQWGRSGLMLWNPSTGKFRKLPSSKRVRSNGSSRRVCAGFGYDESKGDYIFIWMAFRNRRAPRVTRRVEFDVFSLKSKTWRSYNHEDQSSDTALFDMNIGYQQRAGVLSNGAIHWLILYMDGSSPYGTGRILAFDLASEKHGLLELPRECGLPVDVVSLSGCLCLYTDNHMSSRSIDLWMRKECGAGSSSSWIKLASLPSTLAVPRTIFLYMYHPIQFSSEEGSLVAVVEQLSRRRVYQILRLRVYQILRLHLKKGAGVSYETLLSVSRNDVPIVLEETLVSLD